MNPLSPQYHRAGDGADLLALGEHERIAVRIGAHEPAHAEFELRDVIPRRKHGICPRHDLPAPFGGMRLAAREQDVALFERNVRRALPLDRVVPGVAHAAPDFHVFGKPRAFVGTPFFGNVFFPEHQRRCRRDDKQDGKHDDDDDLPAHKPSLPEFLPALGAESDVRGKRRPAGGTRPQERFSALGTELCARRDRRPAVRTDATLRLLFGLCAEGARHLHTHAHAEPRAHHRSDAAAGILRRLFHRVSLRHLRVNIDVAAHHIQAGILVERLFEFGRERNALEAERREPHADGGEALFERRFHAVAQFHEICGEIENGNAALAERVGKEGHEKAADMVCDILRTERGARPGHLLQKDIGIGHTERIRAVCAQADGAVFGVPHDDGRRRPPLEVGELPRADEVDIRFEGLFEGVLPRKQPRKDGNGIGVQLIHAWAEHVRHTPLIAEHDRLPFAHGERRPAFDGVLPDGELPDDDVRRALRPFDDFQEHNFLLTRPRRDACVQYITPEKRCQD